MGRDLPNLFDVVDAARQMRRHGAGVAVISSGTGGLVAVSDEGEFLAKPPWVVFGNPTGAGDALTAALAESVATGRDWPQALRQCVAWSAAAAATPWAGQLDECVLDVLAAVNVVEL